MKKFYLLPAALLCAACAKGPDSIAPVSMGNAFAATSCTDARNQLAEEQEILAALEQKQRNAQTGDAIGVFLILVPVSSITGNDVEGELATSKGKVIALENRLRNC
ncbi:hypothetical protein [uncultured Roseobacter sp.]|uniref:hypothetical protein n=1 Tax=uncultured Roseobacter sp. TaxID=114847 RepID=UPI0026250F61|nr:hypothetical protein [uncultured Roseobacter sp.]